MTYDLTDRQRGYARYLMRLNDARRNNLIKNMKARMADKMRDLIRDEQAKDIQQWNTGVAKIYLNMLKAQNPTEYNELMRRLPDEKKQEYSVQ